MRPRISVIITAHNEGIELSRTLKSVRDNTEPPFEIVLVDDGSTDNSCTDKTLDVADLSVIRHQKRLGVACSRDEASRVAKGMVFAFLDGHQRLTPGCLEQCAKLALEKRSIVFPDLCGFDRERDLKHHGAHFYQRREGPPFGAEWIMTDPKCSISRISSLRAPAYVIPAPVYAKISWSRLLRGWGGSEGAVSLKAFFAGVEILHLCGPVAFHKFKKKFHYKVGWDEVWRNHAITARICFSEDTWLKYWLPKVFAPHLDDRTQKELESVAIRKEHAKFQLLKVRSDHEYWTRLIRRRVPKSLSSQAVHCYR